MQKYVIGIMIACIAVAAVPANAAPKAVKSIVNQAGKVCDDIGSVLWKNKGGIAVGAVTVAAVTNPEPFVQGATTVIAGTTKPIRQSTFATTLFCLLLLALTIFGVRWFFNYLKDWKNWTPLMVVGFVLCFGGIAEAGVFDRVPVIPIKPIPWWHVIDLLLLVLAIFI